MAEAINLTDIKPLIAAVVAEQEALVRENESLKKAIAKNNEKLMILDAKASAFQEVMSMTSRQNLFDVPAIPLALDETKSPKANGNPRVYTNRRMRLGAKKRVVYELVMMGKGSFDSINETIERSSLDIDHRYVREVLRSGKEDGDFGDSEDGSVILTPAGREIVEKAPRPMDWKTYQVAMYAALAPDDEDRDYD